MNILPGKSEVDTTSVADPRLGLTSRQHSFRKNRGVVRSTTSSTSRVYKAPQASVCREKYMNSKQTTTASVGTRRRRRRAGSGAAKPSGHDSATGFMLEPDSDSSIGNVDELPAPPLWGDEDDYPGISPYTRKKESVAPEIAWARADLGAKHSAQIRTGSEDVSDATLLEEELFSAYETHLHTHLHKHDHSNRCCAYDKSGNMRRGPWWNFSHPYANAIQCCVLLFLAFLVFDSHHRVNEHKVQLQEYDEERAHILEQMMWIDQAAKKVHKKYSEQNKESDLPSAASPSSDESIRAALEKLQLRIQLNARDRLAQRFGDKPAEISLKLNDQGEHLIVALSDDTPHAVSILLEQVEHRLWDELRVETASTVGAVQIASTKAATSPLLEFVEPSRGCHEVGSVAIRQQEEDELHVIKLRVNLIANSPMDVGDVCIGRAVSSLTTLQEMASALS